MSLAAMASSSSHWLTLMTCVVCECTPDETPVYLCNLGHTTCLNCFKGMTRKVQNIGVPECAVCGSTKFKAKNVSTDFLKKLKMKPGIGRPFRYLMGASQVQSPSSTKCDTENRDERVTVEKLFQLPSEKIQELFELATKHKLKKIREDTCSMASCRCCKNKASIQKSWNLIEDQNSEWFLKRSQKSIMKEYSSTSVCSRKPLRCPHHPCNKIIAVSSFDTHFLHEHPELKRYRLCREENLIIEFDPNILEYNTTYCLGMITLYKPEKTPESSDRTPSKVTKLFNQKIPLDTFWIMASGSSEAKKTHAYVIFWLFINNDNSYNCVLELSTLKDDMSLGTFCSVNGMHDSHDIKEVTKRLNCLYLTYGGLESILEYGPITKLRIAIH